MFLVSFSFLSGGSCESRNSKCLSLCCGPASVLSDFHPLNHWIFFLTIPRGSMLWRAFLKSIQNPPSVAGTSWGRHYSGHHFSSFLYTVGLTCCPKDLALGLGLTASRKAVCEEAFPCPARCLLKEHLNSGNLLMWGLIFIDQCLTGRICPGPWCPRSSPIMSYWYNPLYRGE